MTAIPGSLAQYPLAYSPPGALVPTHDVVPFDPLVTVISQYANSPIIVQLVRSMGAWLDPVARLDEFFRLVFDVDTAAGYGLDVWGRIVGVSRVLQVATGSFLGFSQDDEAKPFGQGIWFGQGALTSNYALTDVAYRKLILAKAMLNITDGSIPAINQILLNLFGSYGDVHVVDGQNMTIAYSFPRAIDPVDYAIVAQSGVLPKPIGVSFTVRQA
jgi:hypothetical protein